MAWKVLHILFAMTVVLLAATRPVLSQTGGIVSTERQQVGKMVGAAGNQDAETPSRYVKFVAMAREENNKRTERLAVGVGPVNGDPLTSSSEGEPLWALLSIEEAKQASKALRRMNDLANRKPSRDISDKSMSYRTASGLSLQYQEIGFSNRRFTIGTGDGGRKCYFKTMNTIWLIQGCIDRGIEWMEERPKPIIKNKVPPHQGSAYTPKVGTKEREAIMDALRTPFMKALKKKVIFKVDFLKVGEGWAFMMAQAVDEKGEPVGAMEVMEGSTHAFLRKQKGRWKVLMWGGFTDNELIEEAKEKYPSAPRAIFP